LALVLKSPTQMGWLSIINSVTNISRLGTFKKIHTRMDKEEQYASRKSSRNQVFS
jgi:hypothetical protein